VTTPVSLSAGLETNRVEAVTRGEANVGVEGSSETAKQSDGGLGPAFLDALDVIGGHARTGSELGYGHRHDGPPVVDRFAERQGFADGDAFGVVGLGSRLHPPGVVAGHHACLS
jgi:hypothetical protein